MIKEKAQISELKDNSDIRIEQFFNDVFMSFIQYAPKNLINYALNLHSFSESAEYLNLSKDIESSEQSLKESFFINIRVISHERVDSKDFDDQSDKKNVLELLDQDVLDEWLKIQALVKKVEYSIGEKLRTSIQKYDIVCTALDLDSKAPFVPLIVFKTIEKTFEVYDLPVPIKFNLYETVCDSLISLYHDFLSDLDDILTNINTDNSAEHGRIIVGNNHNIAEESSASIFAEEPDEVISPPITDEHVSEGASGNISDTDLQSLLSMLNINNRHSNARAPIGNDTVSSYINNSINTSRKTYQLLSQLNSTLSNNESLIGNPVSKKVPRSITNENNQNAFNIGDIVEGLQYLLKDNDFKISKNQDNQPSVKVQQFLKEKKGLTDNIPMEYREVIDGASYLFSKAKSSYKEKSDIKNLLKRLERPILKLMLTDTDFMVSPNHPARDVVNLIDECSMATNANEQIVDKRLLKFLNLQVDEIDTKFTKDPDIFTKVRDKLLKVLVPIRRARKNRMFKAQQKFQSQQMIANAKSRIDAFIESSLPGEERPRVLSEVLEKGWYQYLILHQLSSDQVKRSETTSVIELLINILLGELRFNETDTKDLVEELIKGLKEIGNDTHLLNSMRAYISDELNKPVDEIEWLKSPIKQPEINDVPIFKSMQSLVTGTWWQFKQDSNWIVRQLIWKSKNGMKLGFTNRSSTETIMMSLKLFAEGINNENIRDYPQQMLPLMERSEQGLFDESYSEMIHSALHDPVTDLLNKKGLINKISHVSNISGIDSYHSICQIEFDQIEIVNLNCGIAVSEKLLSNLASLLSQQLVNNQFLAQVSSNTFVVFLPNVNKTQAKNISDKIIDTLSNYRFEHEREIYSIGLSIGFLEFSPTLLDVVDVLSKVDSACRAAKTQGRNTIIEYSDEDLYLQAQQSIKEWAGRIDRIIENDGLYLRAQRVEPIDSTSGLNSYYEILLGIKDINDANGANDVINYRQISPSHFFPALELWKRSYEVDLWVLKSVFHWVRNNQNLFLKVGGFAINLSAQSLSNSVVLDYLRSELSKGDLPNAKITFEITETATIESYGKAQEFMNEIRKLGCVFSLDDFGAGFSSYSHLKNLDTNTLKIDGSFVRDIVESSTDRMMVRSMNELGKFLGMKTVAEFVENEDILEILKEIGVDYAQGYALHKPIPLTQLEKELQQS